MTSENHRRNPRDDAHVRRICALRPEVETALGLFDHAGEFSDPGPESKAAVVDANVAWRRDLETQATESRERLLDARVFSASLELYKFSDEEVALHKRDPDVVTPIAETLLLHLRGLLPAEPEHRFDSLSQRLKAIRPHLEKARATATIESSPELAIRARDVVDGMPDLLRAIVDAVRTPNGAPAAGGSPARPLPASLQAQVEAGVDDASSALEEHRDWLTGLPQTPPPPLGADRFDELLRLRGLDLTAGEVLDLGRSIAEEMRVEHARVLRRGFRGQAAESALATARKNAPLNLSEAIAWTRELVARARTFIAENGSVPVPSADADNADERVHVDAMPAPMAPAGQACIYVPPQPYAPRQDALLLLREPLGPQTEALKELAVADLESFVATLTFPGRHTQAVWQNRTTTIARRGALFGAGPGPSSTWGTDMVHGWGLVAAELMRELHFRHSPASRLLMVRHALTTALLAVVDVDLAIGRVTPEQASAFLVRRAQLRLPVARALVRSLLRAPTSGISGLVGKVRIEQLRREAHRRWRDGYSERRFHALLLVNGAVPLAYLFERLEEPPTYVTDVVTASFKTT
ncbi:MAG: DUF885 family protein [Deltaproteobacteria bacterium]|nr:DUF885 family protein [Deltaproteobacteria bacterium]